MDKFFTVLIALVTCFIVVKLGMFLFVESANISTFGDVLLGLGGLAVLFFAKAAYEEIFDSK